MLQILETIKQGLNNFVKNIFADCRCSCCGGKDLECVGMQPYYRGFSFETYVFKCGECGSLEYRAYDNTGW